MNDKFSIRDLFFCEYPWYKKWWIWVIVVLIIAFLIYISISSPTFNDIIQKLFNLMGTLPLTELLIGVVVPIVAALISYFLAERATRRKEYNRLFIQIEVVKKELARNQAIIQEYILKNEERNSLKKSLEIPIYPFENLLIEVLSELEKIKNDYFYFDKNHFFDKPNQCYILVQEIKNLDSKIHELESSGYSDEYLDSILKDKLMALYKQKEDYINEFKKYKDRDIFYEFIKIQSFIEQNSYGKEFFEKSDIKDENYVILKFIFTAIKDLNEKPDKEKADVSDLFEKLILFKISSDIIVDDKFSQDNFDLCKGFASPDGFEKKLYDTYEKYYKLVTINKFITNYVFDLCSQKWQENNSDLVLLNDSNLYIAIGDLYETQIKIKDDNNKKLKESSQDIYNQSKKINEAILCILAKMERHKLKIMKWCK